MTPLQFQSFVAQLDQSLKEIGHELSEDEPTAENCRLFLQAIVRKLRLGLSVYGKQILAEEARSAREADRETLTPCNHEHRLHVTDDIYQCEDPGCKQQFRLGYEGVTGL